MILFVLIGIAYCGEIVYDDYLHYGDYGQYDFVPGNKSVLFSQNFHLLAMLVP